MLVCSQAILHMCVHLHAVQTYAHLNVHAHPLQIVCWACSSDGNCPCTCNYATDIGCTCRDLAQSVNVTITKTPVYATYPLTYQQAFNFKPYEVCTHACMNAGMNGRAGSCTYVDTCKANTVMNG